MFDIHQAIFGDGDHDAEAVSSYIEGLMEEFAASPEAAPYVQDYGRVGWAGLMLEYAINYVGSAPPDMSLRDLDEVVFELFPRKVSTEPDGAPQIIAELRAFWSFLQRQYGLPQADQIVRTLDDAAVQRLQQELANPRNFGTAKSFFMLGKKSGFDMTTQKGLDEFLLAYNAGIMGKRLDTHAGEMDRVVAIPRPRSGGQSPRDRAKVRKRQRQARKRNRR